MKVWKSKGSGGKRRSPLRPPKRAKLILKEQFEIDATGDVDVVVPNILILGNRAGFRYLSDYFLWLATRDATLADDWRDPDDHQHMDFPQDPFDAELSDRVSFRLGTLDARNFEAVCDKYQINRQTAERGSLEQRYVRHIEAVVNYCEHGVVERAPVSARLASGTLPAQPRRRGQKAKGKSRGSDRGSEAGG